MIDLSGLERSEAEDVVLVGAGAVADSWEPILDALGNRIPDGHLDAAKDAANVYFATLVHRLRWLKSMSVKLEIADKHHSDYASAFEEAIQEYRKVTRAIAKSIEGWGGNKLRPDGAVIRERLLHRERPFSVVTTNWDLSTEEFLVGKDHDRCVGLNYLHGTYSVGLYLPGEVIDEAYRGPDQRSEFLSSAISTIHMLRDASRLIVWGLRVSPLDAELGFLLQRAARQRTRPFGEVIVVDPDHQAVIRNLRIHLRDQKYIGLEPSRVGDLKLETY